jgi:hypothetical protein
MTRTKTRRTRRTRTARRRRTSLRMKRPPTWILSKTERRRRRVVKGS